MIAISSLIALSSIGVLALLVYGPWQDLCTAFARQIVFEKRDAIFDLAASGELSFEDPDYRTIRTLLEKSIRFAHEVTIPRLLYYYVALRWHGRRPDDKPELIKAVQRIQNAEIRNEVERLVNDSLRTLALMAMIKSPVALVMLVPLFVIAFVAHIGRRFLRTISHSSQALIQIEAERVGSSLDSAAA